VRLDLLRWAQGPGYLPKGFNCLVSAQAETSNNQPVPATVPPTQQVFSYSRSLSENSLLKSSLPTFAHVSHFGGPPVYRNGSYIGFCFPLLSTKNPKCLILRQAPRQNVLFCLMSATNTFFLIYRHRALIQNDTPFHVVTVKAAVSPGGPLKPSEKPAILKVCLPKAGRRTMSAPPV
jgi:hypothetical protein